MNDRRTTVVPRPDGPFWRWLLGILLLPTLALAVALVLLFGRVTALESNLRDTPSAEAVRALDARMVELQADIRELRAEIIRGR